MLWEFKHPSPQTLICCLPPFSCVCMLKKKTTLKPHVVGHALSESRDCLRVGDILAYIESSRPAWAPEWDPVSKHYLPTFNFFSTPDPISEWGTNATQSSQNSQCCVGYPSAVWAIPLSCCSYSFMLWKSAVWKTAKPKPESLLFV